MLGLVPGLFVVLAAARSISALLFGVPPTDAATIFVTVGLCILMSITGALVPVFPRRTGESHVRHASGIALEPSNDFATSSAPSSSSTP